MAKGKTRWVVLALLCVAAMLPPVPRKRHRPITETTQGAGAARLIAKIPKAPPLPDYNRLLVWHWKESDGNYWSNTVFIIKGSPNLKTSISKWEMVGWTPTNYWLFYINLDDRAMFFHVAVSNTITLLVSE